MGEKEKPQLDRRTKGKNPFITIVIATLSVAILSIVVAFYLQSVHNFFIWTEPIDDAPGPVSPEVYQLFSSADLDDDQALSLEEFNGVYYKIKNIGGGIDLKKVEAENVSSEWNFGEDLMNQCQRRPSKFKNRNFLHWL